MPQQTNLNVSPYFDDYTDDSGYHKVLFKPGYPVQARELNNLQSILQNQIEKFGQHFFKEGAKVIPGNTGYNRLYNCVQLNNTYQGVPVAAYADQLIGTKITGETSGVTAVVDKIVLPEESERGNLTLYIAYVGSSTANNSTEVFSDGEELVCNTIISSGLLGNASIAAGSPFAITLANAATATGSCFQIQEGVYFVRGQFVKVASETLILDQYSNTSNYRVGLNVTEEIVNADMDETLNDNSQGYNNYAAPGADRLKITLSLFKKPLDDFDDNSFVEEAQVIEGVLQAKVKTTNYQNISDELARRTNDESGDYIVRPFDITIRNSLNDNVGNRGIFQPGQFTYSGSTPAEDLAVYRLSPGKAYVRGWELETTKSIHLDCPKPRTTKTIQDQPINYNTGPTLRLNNNYGGCTIGIGNTFVLSLRDQKSGDSRRTAPGEEIGVARVYDYRLESGSYNSTQPALNEWNISLYDVQTVTKITLNQPVTDLTVPTFVKGSHSGATAFLKDSVQVGAGLTLYETTGDFTKEEALIFNGVPNGRVATAITSYSITDVKSVFGTDDGTVGTGATFSANVVQSPSLNVGVASVTKVDGSGSAPYIQGISTITSSNQNLFDTIKIGDTLQFTNPNDTSYPTQSLVVSKDTGTENSVQVTGVTTISGMVYGALPVNFINVSDLSILSTQLQSSSDNTLFTRLPKDYISDLDLTNAQLTIRKAYTVNIVNNQLSQPVSTGSSETFLPFDEERYSLIRSDGSTEALASDTVIFDTTGTSLQVYNLGTNDTGAQLVTSIKRLKPKAKEKIKQRVNTLIIDKSRDRSSGIGSTTLNDGLSYGNYPYGTRVQDELLSLNTPDVIGIHAIYESADTNNPSAPKMVLSDINSASTTSQEFIIGEYLVGQTSGAVAIYAENISNSTISYVYKNEIVFVEGEVVVFQESNVQGTITTLESTSFEIGGSYTYSTGQEKTIYDYGSINRRFDRKAPKRKLKVYFQSGYYESTDDGDITTVNSYKNFNYATEVQSIDGISNADIIDIRPRVSDYTTAAGTRSPLEFYGRAFNGAGQSAANILASDETIISTYSNYLGRIDRIFLTKDGKFQVRYGTPAERPERPGDVDTAIELATVTLPPYLFNTQQADIRFHDHKRYRMVDIRNLEQRIKNLEYYTALSLLEINTANMFVPDGDGLNRFKSGFFVDNFEGFMAQESQLEIKNSIDRKNKEVRPKHYTNSADLVFGPVVNVDPTADQNFSLIEGLNVRKQNDTLTLDYAEVVWLEQNFATRSESVTPFLISFWQGTMELTPASDTWVDTVRIEAKVIETEGNYAETMAEASRTMNVDPQTGFAPVVWDAWQTNWTGQQVTNTQRQNTTTTRGDRFGRGGWINGGSGVAQWVERETTTTVREELRETIQTGVESRTGTRTVVTEHFDRTSVGDRVVSRDLVPFMRSRNVEFVSKKMKPLTQMYGFFDGEDVTRFCVPKLLEIDMTSGTFQVGETVTGQVIKTGLGIDQFDTIPSITFRVAQSNHKEGQYDLPTSTFMENPYTGTPLSGSYSSTSTLLNVDTYSLANEAQGEFFGWVETGMVFTGQTSGAQATVTNVRLLSDLSATLIGSYYIPNPNNINFPRFEVGTSVFTLTNDKDNNQDDATTIAEEAFTASGTLETVQENIISVRNARIEQRQEFQERNVNRSLGTEVVGSTVIGRQDRDVVVGWYDPLAQSFLVEEDTGVFLTKCDIFFRTKDDMDIPCVFQLRSMKNGFPTQHILPFSEIVLDPADITTSGDGSVATTIEFKSPVYCEKGQEYAIALASNSTKYSVYISRIGENDLLTQTFISNQPYLGSLFKSQNASTWEASQWEDLKFTLYRADFIESGSVEFYSPQLTQGNGQIPTLMPNSLNLISN